MGEPARSLEIRLFGELALAVDGRSVPAERLRNRKARHLLTMLALADRHALHREQVMERLWPDASPESAANQLYKALHALRRALEPDLAPRGASAYVVTGTLIRLVAPGGVSVDALRFDEAARAALETRAVADLERAAALYTGELLPEDLYDEWTTEPRERLRLLHREVLYRLAVLLRTDGRDEESAARFAELLMLEPSDERAHRGLMRIYIRAGHANRAVEQYLACREALARDLDAEPEPATEALLEKARARPVVATVDRDEEPRSVKRQHTVPPEMRWPWPVMRVAAAVVCFGLASLLAVAAWGVGEQRLLVKLERLRTHVRLAVADLRGEPRRIVTVRGRLTESYARVELLDSASGFAAFTDETGAFTLPNALTWPCESSELLLTTEDHRSRVLHVRLPAALPDSGAVDLGTLDVAPSVPPTRTVGYLRNSVASVALDRTESSFYQGVFLAVTVGGRTDDARLLRFNRFVASRYSDDETPPNATPRETLANGSHWSGELAFAFAAAVRAAGYEVRLVDVSDPAAPARSYSVVEVRYGGGWHMFDPALGYAAEGASGEVASYEEVLRRPEIAPDGLLANLERPGWAPQSIARLYTSGLHRYRYFDVDAPSRLDL